MPRDLLLVPVVCASLVTSSYGGALTDDFSTYPERSEGAPTWEADDLGFAVQVGQLTVRGANGHLVCRKLPPARRVSIEATIIPRRTEHTGWITAGISIFQNSRNYWKLGLVEAPLTENARRVTELHECRDGRWLADVTGSSTLEKVVSIGRDYSWDYDRPYLLRLILEEGRIAGTVQPVSGEVVSSFAYRLKPGAVTWGSAAISSTGLNADFDDVSVEVRDPVPEAALQRTFPPYKALRQAEPVAKPTGFFRAEKIEDRWWFIDPEGKAFFAVGTDHCNYNVHWCEKLGYAPYHMNLEKQYGSPERWASGTVGRLKEWNFNTLGVHSSPEVRHSGLAHVENARLGTQFARREWIAEPINWTGFPNVFSPDWERFCRIRARTFAEDFRGDPWYVGAFIDNELEWYGKTGYIADDVMALPAGHSAKKALISLLRDRYGSIENLNNGWETHLDSFDAIASLTKPPDPGSSWGEDRKAFLHRIAEEYFRVTCTALREADPDHLILGSRFANRCPDEVLEVAGKYVDVFSLNTYPRLDLTTRQVLELPERLKRYYSLVRRPMLITEWSFPALDSGLPCLHGAGMRVDTQAQKALCYRVYAEMIASLPFMVGQHYFMWVDEPELGIRSTFPEDSNYGLVDVHDKPYKTFVSEVRKVNEGAHSLHGQSCPPTDFELRILEEGIRVRNRSDRAGQALLTYSIGKSRGETEIKLGSRAETTVPLPTTKQPGPLVAVATLRTPLGTGPFAWNLVGGNAVHASEGTVLIAAINRGGEDLMGVPVISDLSEGAAAVRLTRIESGEGALVSVPRVEATRVDGFEWNMGPIILEKQAGDGSAFSRIRANGLPLGRVAPLLHQRVAQDLWVEPQKTESICVLTYPDARVAELVLSGGRETEEPPLTRVMPDGKEEKLSVSPRAFRIGIRTVAFKDLPCAFLKALWIENADRVPWRLERYFHYAVPAIGGDSIDDVTGIPSVPNYYLQASAWTDEKLGGALGVSCLGSEDFRIRYWIDKGWRHHPDAWRDIGRDLKPGERLKLDEPYIVLFGFGKERTHEWRDFALKVRSWSQVKVEGVRP